MKQKLIGLGFILLALVLLLQGLFGSWHISFWFLGMGLVFLLLALQSFLRKRWVSSFFWLGLLAVQVNHAYHLIPLSTPLLFGVLLLLTLGVKMVFPSRGKGSSFGGELTESEQHIEVNFGSSDKYINQAFDQLETEVNFATFSLYIGDFEVSETMCLEVDVNFSSMSIYIPKTYQLQLQIENSFSTVNSPGESPTTGPILRIRGDVNFSTLEIEYV